MLGTNILNCEVTNITNLGFWILISNNDEVKEYFIPFTTFPDFKKSSIEQIMDVKASSPYQLHWESLDIDIEINSLKDPVSFPLKFK